MHVVIPHCSRCETSMQRTLNKQAGTKIEGNFPISAQGKHNGWCVHAAQQSAMARSLHLHAHHLACDGEGGDWRGRICCHLYGESIKQKDEGKRSGCKKGKKMAKIGNPMTNSFSS